MFDVVIHGKPLVLKKARKEYTVTGRGGTDFQPVLDFACDHQNYDGIIIFTDGIAPEPILKRPLHTKVLWICNSEQNYNRNHLMMEKIGRVCQME